MNEQHKYRATDKMSDLICDNYSLLMVMSRFGLSLGFGDKSVKDVCESQHVDYRTFLAVANFISEEQYSYSADNDSFSIPALMDYLKRAHAYFLDFNLPAMRRKLIEAIDCSRDNDVVYLILKFFDEYAKEVRRHMEYENKAVFTYVEQLLQGRPSDVYNIATFASKHNQIDTKLKELKNEIASQLRQKIETVKRAEVIAKTQMPNLETELDATKTPVLVRTLLVTDTGDAKESSSEITSIIGLVAGLIIYFFIFMYASQVMKGVIEEKTNRIIEVLVSSVKPFQFLLGKIIGVAAVGLVQFLIWIVLGGGIILISQAFFMPNLDLEALKNANDLNMFAQGTEINPEQLAIIQNLVKTIDPMFILKFVGAFLFYFIGGYLLYASLFAAIGAAVDNETDSQQFMTPLSIILVVALYIGVAAMKSPESPMVFWSSLIPFTSPVVMLVRIPFGVPAWEIITSMGLLVGSFLFFTWLSGKIYRVGILMYGKKVTWKELYKWLRYKA